MEIIFSPEANDDLNFFIKSGNKAVLKKVSELIKINSKHSISRCW
jgi:Txe/YoeB family toxin of Txe-Axe toxin-antitoxin module